MASGPTPRQTPDSSCNLRRICAFVWWTLSESQDKPKEMVTYFAIDSPQSSWCVVHLIMHAGVETCHPRPLQSVVCLLLNRSQSRQRSSCLGASMASTLFRTHFAAVKLGQSIYLTIFPYQILVFFAHLTMKATPKAKTTDSAATKIH